MLTNEQSAPINSYVAYFAPVLFSDYTPKLAAKTSNASLFLCPHLKHDESWDALDFTFVHLYDHRT